MTVGREATSALPDSLVRLGREICRTILHVAMDGWAIACSRGWVVADMDEICITEKLRDAMREVVEHPSRLHLTIRAGTETRSKPEVVIPDGRTDMSIFLTNLRERYPREHDHHGIVECKRVAGDDSELCRLFVAKGVDRFVSGKYSARHATGFMVGYVLRGSVDAACSGINRRLRKVDRSSEELEACRVLQVLWARSSRHPRSGGSPIDLHHAFLDFEQP